MVRQYRIEPYNGVEFLVCECFRKHTWTQAENDAFFAYMEDEKRKHPGIPVLEASFLNDLNDFLAGLRPGEDSRFYGLDEPVPVYDTFPCVVLRCAVVDGRPASIQVDFLQSVMSPTVLDEINRLFGVFDSRHWRDMVAHQLANYGTLFSSSDD